MHDILCTPQFIAIKPGWRTNSLFFIIIIIIIIYSEENREIVSWRKATTQSAVTRSSLSYSISICYCNSTVASIQFNLYNLLALQGQMSCWWSIISMEKVAFCFTPWKPSQSLRCIPSHKQSLRKPWIRSDEWDSNCTILSTTSQWTRLSVGRNTALLKKKYRH
jgi:hypothetical protein